LTAVSNVTLERPGEIWYVGGSQMQVHFVYGMLFQANNYVCGYSASFWDCSVSRIGT